ncbi:Jag family protein [Nesterenkonia cremea]|uniref:R3H domain-containing protein n=1 Tax=Nesterenkonia cremea TaxID=1882340 RepID=A0A917ELL7_9MICC|nr:R3H domain-containing nucleic acid-binding protein [Nesterenkonia cremea]GGE57851.1 hypothetical protein GCM10011401_00710 [Nesterenkonia cremea]
MSENQTQEILESEETEAPEAAEDQAAEQAEEQQEDTAEENTEDEGGDAADEGDIAADYLEELLDIADLDGDLDIEVRGERTFISIVADEGGDELDNLVGRKGEVLDALQELTRLAVLTATGSRTRLVLDVAGHREQRQSQLKRQADDAVAEVKEHGNVVHLEPMSAYERKIVHDFVAEAGLVSESEGEGKRRHVVVSAD